MKKGDHLYLHRSCIFILYSHFQQREYKGLPFNKTIKYISTQILLKRHIIKNMGKKLGVVCENGNNKRNNK